MSEINTRYLLVFISTVKSINHSINFDKLIYLMEGFTSEG